MIDDHMFRQTHAGDAGTATGSQGGIAKGMCAWLGTCGRPAGEHATRKPPQYQPPDPGTRARIAQDYADCGKPAEVAARWGVTASAVRYYARCAGVPMRPRGAS